MSKENKLIPKLRFPEFVKNEEWVEKKLGSIGEPLMCKRIFKNQTTPNPENGIPFYKIGTFGREADSYISVELYNEFKSKYNFPNKGDILISASGTIGRLVIYDGAPAYFQDSNIVWLGHNGMQITNDFLFYCYSIVNWQTSDGGVIKRLYNSDLKNISIYLPENLNEQQKIASCLSSLDELIAAHKDKLRALKDHKKGLMQNLFPQQGQKVPNFRFPEFEGDGEWVNTTVDDNCLVKGRIGYRGYTKQDLVKKGEGALVLGGKHIQNQLLDLSDPTFLSWEKYYESPEIMVEINHIIFSQRGSLGDCAIIDRKIGKATINPSMVLIKDISCNPRFLYYILIGDRIQSEVSKNKTSAAIPMLSQKQIKEFQFLIPKPEEQQKIASCLSSLDELIAAQSEKIEQLQQHKKGLMQGLFPKSITN